ncbi:tRNA(Ile)-lysidine synthase [Geomicrobium halophilum]|uniref:tRNA(Ile)-lysidine synthase n=1 Tax=Geomicrobium halophilum TaxID=549000 RepID=A0A841Q2U8_9BACL|nr:tRNA lysidine(34) synthetase TilS [Geomicrobium halophilum]MBB6451558.1 tRNA(Ile)-lysidine synthase [Geomicrobium halophilum]
MKQKIAEFLARHQMFPKGSSVLVAVSGGVDSMALLHYLHSQKDVFEITVNAVHCNHGLREEAWKEKAVVQQFCADRDIPFFYKNLGVKKEHNTSIQQVSREKRYEFFSQIMKTDEIDRLATAHHGDDQVETMLMKQMRGFNYYGGEMGIAANRLFGTDKRIIRPFLPVTKKDIIDYSRRNEVPWCEDTSNESNDYTRNRIRKKLLPTLKSENKEVHTQFQMLAEDLREDALFLRQQAEKIVKEAAAVQTDEVTLDLTRFRHHPFSLQRRVIHLLLNYLYHQKNAQFSRVHIEDCLELITAKHPSAELSLPDGVSALRNYEELCLSAKKHKGGIESPQELREFPVKLESAIGTLSFAEGHTSLSDREPTVYCCPMSQLSLPIYVRTRKPGDIMRPLGLSGTQKLKQIMIDAKVPRRQREHWPVITDALGNILWVPLLKKNEGANQKAKDSNYLVIELFKNDGTPEM